MIAEILKAHVRPFAVGVAAVVATAAAVRLYGERCDGHGYVDGLHDAATFMVDTGRDVRAEPEPEPGQTGGAR